MTTATSTTTTAAEQREADAMRLAWTLPSREVSRALDDIERTIARRMGESIHADAARADATSRALVSMANGTATGPAVGAACRDAIADATRRAATVALVSLDAPVGEDGATLADALDSGDSVSLAEHGRARLSAMGSSTGGYRGVARVPVPTDCLAAPLVSPVMLAELTRAEITPDALTVLDATVAANVAAEQQRRAHIDALTAYVDGCKLDAQNATRASRGGLVSRITAARKQAEKARRDARSEERNDHNPHRPRTSEVAAILTGKPASRGRATVALAAKQAAAWTAYQTHRAALVSATLDAWTASLDAQAARQRQSAAAVAWSLAPCHTASDTETPAQRIARQRNETRRARHLDDTPRRRHAAHHADPFGTAPAHLDDAAKVRQYGDHDHASARNGAGWNKGASLSAKGSTWAEPRTVEADAVTARPRTFEHAPATRPTWTNHRPGSADYASVTRHHCHADNEGIPATEGSTHRAAGEPVATTFEAIAAACDMADEFPALPTPADWDAPSAPTAPLPRTCACGCGTPTA